MHLAFVPGIMGRAGQWSSVLPPGCNLSPVDYKPSSADEPPADRTGGLPGDFVDVAALRLLSETIHVAVSGRNWALGAHSAGGAVVYRCLDHIADLVGEGRNGSTKVLLDEASKWLPDGEAQQMAERLEALGGQPFPLPWAVFSFEGTLMAADVEGWADDWAERDEPIDEDWCWEALNDPEGGWTWPMARSCAASLWARCASEPPRHLASIRRWLEMPDSPGFIYVAGEQSAERNAKVFPALRQIAEEGGNEELLRIVELKGAGHNMADDAPDAVCCTLAEGLGLPPPPPCAGGSSRWLPSCSPQ